MELTKAECDVLNERRDLVKAGALILAEIERMDRAALPPNYQAKRALPAGE